MKDNVIWLSTNIDLPRILIHPNIKVAPRAEIEALRHKGFLWLAPHDLAIEGQRVPLGAREVVAVTIYLPEGWTGTTPAEQSVLVHEMVHHLQNLGKLKSRLLASSLLMPRRTKTRALPGA